MTVTLTKNARGPILTLGLPAFEDEVLATVRNNTTGKSLSLLIPAGWEGDDLVLDFFRRTITDQNGDDRSSLLSTSDSELWRTDPLEVGENDLEVEFHFPGEGTDLNTGPRSPGTLADSNAIGTVAWSNPSNAAASDNSRATANLSEPGLTSHYLKATNFGFTLPEGATVLGIEARVEKSKTELFTLTDAEVKIVKGGVVGSTNKRDIAEWPVNNDGIVTYGGPTDLWGTTWAVADVNGEGFGLVIAAQGRGVARVDDIEIVVYYSYAPEGEAYAATASLEVEQGYF